ncbi:MAG: hypothetical protein GVY18_13805 [Bacteroidetes bacterium]|nr:hypothetical protein [Bacteroidota bacterium]
MPRFAALYIAIALPAACLAAENTIIWWEAEDFAESNWPGGKSGRGAFAPQNDDHRAKLSGGTWLNVAGKRDETLYAEYALTVGDDGEYDFYVRKFWHHGPFRYRWDDGEWVEVTGRLGLLDSTSLRKHVGANWVPLPSVTLEAGKHRLRVELLEKDGAACFDCFVLARGLFLPSGPRRPGEKLGLVDEGTWAFEPGVDPFDADRRKLDIGRLLGQDAIGPDDWITTRGQKFIGHDGKPLRFWGTTIGTHRLGLRQLRYQARRLATLGVNTVRIHQSFEPTGEDSELTDVNEELLAGLHRVVAAMRDSGIYVKLSPYYVLPAKLQRGWGIETWPTDKAGRPVKRWDKPFGLLFFDETLQRGYKAWLRHILTRPNSNTGVPLAKDPALFMLQIQNEDSLFFWTFLANIPEGQRRKLGGKFATWLKGRYGSLEKALAAWGGEQARLDEAKGPVALADDFEKDVAGLMIAWAMTRQYKRPAHQKRLADQVRFLAETQHAFNAEIARHVREELGYRGLIAPNNWRTADDVALLDVERWTYTAGDVIDRHHYYGVTHVNPRQPRRASYAVDKGDGFVNASALLSPRKLPVNFRQIAGFPNIISEFTWVQPNRFQADGPLVMAAYGALADIDGLYWFASGNIDYDPTMTKFQVNTPPIMGQFPATSLIYRAGLVDAAPPVVTERRPLEDLWQRKLPLIAEEAGYDPGRDAGEHDASVALSVDPLAYLVGRVEVAFEAADGRASSEISDVVENRINRRGRIVGGANGEVFLDYGRGLLTVDAPQAQGGAGFLGKVGRIELGNVSIACDNDYAAVIVVPLDGQPIAASRRLLVQVATEARPHGWKTAAATFKPKKGKQTVKGRAIRDFGGAPWNVVKAHGTVDIRNPHVTVATALDAHGYAKADAAARVDRINRGVRLHLPPNAMYVILQTAE